MSEYAITPVSVASRDAPSQEQQEAVAPVKVGNLEAEYMARQILADENKSQEAPKSKNPGSNAQYTDVHLKFQVDDDTNEITVLILDKISKEVIRTIPPEELSSLRAGDLFELFM